MSCVTMVHQHEYLLTMLQKQEETMNYNMRMRRNVVSTSSSSRQEQHQQKRRHSKLTSSSSFFINDNIDILREILKRLDGPSLGVASCVCRLWCSLTTNDDSIWEHLCFRHVITPPPASVRPVVVALGGYKRLYMVCVRPVLSRLGNDSERVRKRVWTRHEVQLSLSLFCIDSYERLSGGMLTTDASAASSLMFLCNPINV